MPTPSRYARSLALFFIGAWGPSSSARSVINDLLQIYLAVTCWWKVLTGNVQPMKIWSKLPRQGII